MSARPSTGNDADAGAHWEHAPLFYDVIDEDGIIRLCNHTEAEALGYEPNDVIGSPLTTVYPREAANRLLALIAEGGSAGEIRTVRLRMRRRDRSILEVAASVNGLRLPDGKYALRLAKTRIDPLLERLEQVEKENSTLHGMIATARDACWCIEFVEPVDLSAPDPEIIRQVFENESHWRFCNRAMARLYRFPEDLDFNAQDVRVLFPHNRENEAFVQQLIDADFHVDGAPSLDRRYDDLPLHADNDVRGYIHEGRLYRMWGVVRDLSEARRKERELSNQVNAVLDVLSSLPDPVLVVAEDGTVEGANPALEWAMGWPVDSALGRAADGLIAFPGGLKDIIARARAGDAGPSRAADLHFADGSVHAGLVSVGAIVDSGPAKRVVMTVRIGSAEGAVDARSSRRVRGTHGLTTGGASSTSPQRRTSRPVDE